MNGALLSLLHLKYKSRFSVTITLEEKYAEH